MKFFRRIRVIATALLLGATAVSSAMADATEEAQAPTNRVDLFNGCDFTGLKLQLL